MIGYIANVKKLISKNQIVTIAEGVPGLLTGQKKATGAMLETMENRDNKIKQCPEILNKTKNCQFNALS